LASLLLLRTVSSGIFGDGALPYGTALRKLRMVRLERAYSQRVWLAMRVRSCEVRALLQVRVFGFGSDEDKFGMVVHLTSGQ
jgi:hypothetical protein